MALQRDDVQVLVIGEAHEWETVEYVDDAVAAGLDKALIVIGHIPSEQAGMEECARWLKGFVTEVPVEFVAAANPFWHPRIRRWSRSACPRRARSEDSLFRSWPAGNITADPATAQSAGARPPSIKRRLKTALEIERGKD